MILAFQGGQGSGKTLSAANLCASYYRKGYTIVTNMKTMTIPHEDFNEAMFKDPSIMERLKKKIGSSKIILFLDEIHLLLDSRRSGTNASKSQFLTQVRKTFSEQGHLIYTTQYFHQIDKRLRYNTSMVIHVKKDIIGMRKVFTWIILKPSDEKDDFVEFKRIKFLDRVLLSEELYEKFEIVERSEDYE